MQFARFAIDVRSLQEIEDDHQTQNGHPDKAPVILPEDDQRQHELKTYAPEDWSQIHFSPVVGHGPGKTQQHHQAEDAHNIHACLL